MKNIYKSGILNFILRAKSFKLASFLVVLFLVSSTVQAQSSLKIDQEQIIEKCIKFKPLLEKIPTKVQSKMSEFLVLDHGIDFQISETMKVEGVQLKLISKAEIDKTKPYFLFHTIHIDKDSALVRYNFIYFTDGVENTIPIVIEFTKEKTQWSVSNYSI